ncbi:MAG TPA: sirohydrochlorin chelatase [Streptosporangiaceae bacterium]|nr:sirohydrochlorin chelatase [Streptosporangiaceae bacterium]
MTSTMAGPARLGPPLLLVGHGTRSGRGVAEFAQFTRRVRALAPAGVGGVDGGFIELAGPSVAEVVASRYREWAVTRGGRPVEVVAVPLVLTSAGHGKGDIPGALARERVSHPGLSFRYGRPLGPHPVLQDLLAARVSGVLGGAPRAGTHVLLVGRGSTDPDANAEVAKVARLLWEGRGYETVEYAFVSLAEPSVPAALERTTRLGARRIVVAPYFLFPGVLPDRVTAQSREFGACHDGVDVRVAGLIGDCDELAGLVLERYNEALHGDIRMNCDTCAYRVALPGFTDKVGQPQTPHHHPHDGHSHDDHDHHTQDHALVEVPP